MKSYGRRNVGLLESAALLVVAWACVLWAILRGLWDAARPLRRLARREPWWVVNGGLALLILALLLYAGRAHAMGGKAPAPPPVAEIAVDGDAEGAPILPGAWGVNLQFPRYDQGPSAFCAKLPETAEEHAACVAAFGAGLAPAFAEAGVRAVAVSWGNTLTGPWDRAAAPWASRPVDCRPGSGVCERPLVGPAEACALARRWDLGAVAFGVPADDRAPDAVRKIAAAFDAAGCADVILYAAVGVEATAPRGYVGHAPASVAALVKSTRAANARRHLTVLAYGMLGARWGKPDAVAYNAALAEALASPPSPLGGEGRGEGAAPIAVDLHAYLTAASAADLLGLAPREAPAWLRVGGLPGVSIEAAILGPDRDLKKTTDAEPPWDAALATADLLREGWAQGLEAVVLFDAFSRAPREWPFALFRLPSSPGEPASLTTKARAAGFLAAAYRGWRLPGRYEAGGLRLLATRDAAGVVHVLGGCFAAAPCEAALSVPGRRLASAETMEEGAEVRPLAAEGGLFSVPARSLVRTTWRKP